MYKTVHHFLAIFLKFVPVENYQIGFLSMKVIFCTVWPTNPSPNSGFEEECTFLYSISGRSSAAHASLYSMNTWGSVTRRKAERRRVENWHPSSLRISGALPPIPIYIFLVLDE
jgi:hypothetical protein